MHSLWLCLLGLASPMLASLEDLANCDPLKKDSSCPPDLAFAGTASFDFVKSTAMDSLQDFWDVDEASEGNSKSIGFDSNGQGLAFSAWKDGQAPTLTSKQYMFFGKLSVEAKAAKGQGLISAIVMKSDSGDEIDWEFLGAYENQAQSNYFYDGQALFNTYNDTYDMTTSSYDDFHTYGVEWTDSMLQFSIDDKVVKTWQPGGIPSSSWPQTPMQVKLGLWAVNKDVDGGEIEWAGGVPDWSKGPYTAYVKSVQIEDYAGGCEETEKGARVEYEYDERTYGWEDVQVRGCKLKLSPGMYTPDASSLSSTAAGYSRGSVNGDRFLDSLTIDTDATLSSGPTGTAAIPEMPSSTSATAEATSTSGSGDDDGKGQGNGSDDKDGQGNTGDDDEGIAMSSWTVSSTLAALVFSVWLIAV